MNAVTLGKSDGSEGLFSDHFSNGTRKLYILLSILFTLFLCHSFSPDSMILGTMNVIPKDKKKSFGSSKVIPIFKKDSKKLIKHYRPISVQPVILKIYEMAIHEQLSDYFTSNSLVCTQQYGFINKMHARRTRSFF